MLGRFLHKKSGERKALLELEEFTVVTLLEKKIEDNQPLIRKTILEAVPTHYWKEKRKTISQLDRDPSLFATSPIFKKDSMESILKRMLLLKGSDLFAEVEEETLLFLLEIATETEYSPGESIYRKGGAATQIYMVLDGKVKLHQGEHMIRTAEQGGCFGDLGVFEGGQQMVDATAETQVRLFQLDREDLLYLLKDNPHLTYGFLQTLSQHYKSVLASQE